LKIGGPKLQLSQLFIITTFFIITTTTLVLFDQYSFITIILINLV
jgi:hypothetical protein